MGDVWLKHEHGALVEQYGQWKTKDLEDESVSVCPSYFKQDLIYNLTTSASVRGRRQTTSAVNRVTTVLTREQQLSC